MEAFDLEPGYVDAVAALKEARERLQETRDWFRGLPASARRQRATRAALAAAYERMLLAEQAVLSWQAAWFAGRRTAARGARP